MYWGWYKDVNTFKLFMHLLLAANIKSHDFMGVTIHRGEVATSYQSLAQATGLSVRSVRTALEHLKATGDLTVKRQAKFSIISIPRYDYYQGNRQASRQSTDTRPTNDRQQSKNGKEGEEGPSAPSARRPAKESTYSLALRLAQEAEDELAAEGGEDEEGKK